MGYGIEGYDTDTGYVGDWDALQDAYDLAKAELGPELASGWALMQAVCGRTTTQPIDMYAEEETECPF